MPREIMVMPKKPAATAKLIKTIGKKQTKASPSFREKNGTNMTGSYHSDIPATRWHVLVWQPPWQWRRRRPAGRPCAATGKLPCPLLRPVQLPPGRAIPGQPHCPGP